MKDPNAIMVTKRKKMFGRNTGQNPSEASIQNPVGSTSKLQRFAALTAEKLLWDLPKNLGDFIGKNPTNIIKADSVSIHADDGFNVIMWQNGADFKLYVENRNKGGDINPKTQITYTDVLDLAKKVDKKSKQPLPNTIVIKTRNFDLSKWEAKKMVLDLLATHRESSTPGNIFSVLKEIIGGPFQDGTVTITFSVKSGVSIDPIMTLESFRTLVKNKQVANIPDLLSAYRLKLQEGVQKFRRVETQAEFKEISVAAESLEQTLDNLISEKRGLFSNRAELPPLMTLRQQVASAIKNDFKNELDTMRRQEWGRHKPFTEDQIVPGTEELVGAGAQGEVYQYHLRRVNTGSDFVAVVKFDDTGLGLNDPARSAGIPEANPQQSVRAVAAYQISDMLNLDIIPRTEFFVGTDDNGRPKLGQAMGFVDGYVGQRKVALRDGNPLSVNEFADLGLTDDINRYNSPVASEEDKRQVIMKFGQKGITKFGNEWYKVAFPISIQEGLAQRLNKLQDILENPNSDVFAKDDARKVLNSYVKREDGKWYNATYLPVDIDYDNPVVQKGLSDLQVFDCIIGHADRNAGNWIYEKKGNTIIGVKGIDNDDTFGKDWSPEKSKTPGIPPIVDISTALSILNANSANIRPLLAGLSEPAIAIAVERFDQVKQEVGYLVKEGKIASIGDDVGVQNKLEELRILTKMEAKPGILRWGDRENSKFAVAHTEKNSYLGYQIAQKNFWVLPQNASQLV